MPYSCRQTYLLHTLPTHTTNEKFSLVFHPSIFITCFSFQGRRAAGANSSSHCARGDVHPGQVVGPFHGQIEANVMNNHSQFLSHLGTIKNYQWTQHAHFCFVGRNQRTWRNSICAWGENTNAIPKGCRVSHWEATVLTTMPQCHSIPLIFTTWNHLVMSLSKP